MATIPLDSGSNINPNAPFPRTILSAVQIAAVGYWANFRGSALVEMIAIALAESSGDTGALSHATSDNSYGRGILQIESSHPETLGPGESYHQVTAQPPMGGTSTDPCYNPYYSFQWAYTNSSGGSNLSPWDSDLDNRGKFMGVATTAAAQVTASHGGTLPDSAGGATLPAAAKTAPVVTRDLINSYQPAVNSDWGGKPGAAGVYGLGPEYHMDDLCYGLSTDLSDAKYLSQVVSQNLGGSTMRDLLMSASIEFSYSQIAQMTLIFTAGDSLLRDGTLFPTAHAPYPVFVIKDLVFAITSLSLDGDDGGRPQLTVQAQPAACVEMQYNYTFYGIATQTDEGASVTASFPGEENVSQSALEAIDTNQATEGEVSDEGSVLETDSGDGTTVSQFPTDLQDSESDAIGTLSVTVKSTDSSTKYILREIQKLGYPLSAVAKDTFQRPLVPQQQVPDPTTGALPTSLWGFCQQLAQEEGFWCFEAHGILYYGPPTWLAQVGNQLDLTYYDVLHQNSANLFTPVGTPQVTVDIETIPNAWGTISAMAPVRKMTFQVLHVVGCQVKPGDRVNFQGLSNNTTYQNTNPNLPDSVSAVNTLAQPWVVTSVAWNFDGGVTPVTIECQEAVDPRPTQDTLIGDDTGDLNTAAAAGSAGAGGTNTKTTAYTTGLGGGNNYTGSKAATVADFLGLAGSKVGDAYVWGATGSTTFDCSGLVLWCLSQMGISPPRTAAEQFAWCNSLGMAISVTEASNTPGALIFLANDGPGSIYHVAISLGGDSLVAAVDQQYGVAVQQNIDTSFQYAALVPGLSYTTAPATTLA